MGELEPLGLAHEVDRVLDKISATGLESLSPKERKLLDEMSERLRKRYLLVPAELFALGIWVLGAIILVIAYIRRRRVNRRRLDQWAIEEAAHESAASAQNV